MKRNLTFIAIIGLSIIVKAQTTWPAGADYVYFGHPNLNHSVAGNFALLQHKLGTTYLNSPLLINFRINNSTKMVINKDGSIGIGTLLTNNPNGHKLAVNGSIGAKAVRVEVSTSVTWADYVFDKKYKLKSIKELDAYVKTYKHLPNIPSASEVEKDGIDVATMDAKLLEKIEELTLYIIELNKRIELLEVKQ